MAFFFILSIPSILHFIGLYKKNHFLLIPYVITTAFLRIPLVILLLFCLIVLTNSSEHIETYIFIAYLFASTYFLITNIILYNKLSSKYNLELRASRMGEPIMKYSELNDDGLSIGSSILEYV